MSTNANYVIIHGIKISKRLAEKMNKEFGSKQGRIFRRWVEKLIEFNNTADETRRMYLWGIEQYIKRDEKGNYIKPITPIWSDYSEEDLKKMEKDFDSFLIDKVIQPKKDERGVPERKLKDMWEKVWHPCSDFSMEPVIGIKSNELYSGIAWDFHEVLGDKIIELQSTKPWETSVHKSDGVWLTFNGENMLHPQDAKSLSEEDRDSIDRNYPSKAECIANQKRIWNTYNKLKKPYPNHKNEMWGWSYPMWHDVDMFIEACNEIWPEINNEPTNYKKFLLFHWS